MNLIANAIEYVGSKRALAVECGVTHQCVTRWLIRGYLPRTELTGESKYSKAIERATGGKITTEKMLRATRNGWRAAKRAA